MCDGLYRIRVNAAKDWGYQNEYLTIMLRNRDKYSAAIHLDFKE